MRVKSVILVTYHSGEWEIVLNGYRHLQYILMERRIFHKKSMVRLPLMYGELSLWG